MSIAGVGLSVFGLQQSALWGWGNRAIEVEQFVAGVLILGVFYAVERRTASPLINVQIFANRAFTVENVVLGIAMMAFIPVFFFASVYSNTSMYMLPWFHFRLVVDAGEEEHRDERHHGDAEDDVLYRERPVGEDLHVDQW